MDLPWNNKVDLSEDKESSPMNKYLGHFENLYIMSWENKIKPYQQLAHSERQQHQMRIWPWKNWAYGEVSQENL